MIALLIAIQMISAADLAIARQALARWRDDPVVFAEQALAQRVWKRQAELMRAVAQHPQVAVRSGHKTGKSRAAASIALWWAMTRPQARVVMSSTTDRQVKKILWRELKAVHQEASRKRFPLGGVMHDDPATGLVFPDGREIFGFTAKHKEAMAGISSPNLLYIVDEASGVEDDIFAAMDGNLASGGRIVMFSQGTRTSGFFYDAFHERQETWHAIQIGSQETPNVTGDEEPIRGLATPEWLARKKLDWGEDSPMYAVRVKGEFPGQAENAIVGLALLDEARKRYGQVEAIGQLVVGVDVARYGDDESVIQPVRGKVSFVPKVLRSMDTVAVAGFVREVVRQHRNAGEKVRVQVDTIGVGAGVADNLRSTQGDDGTEVVDINVSESSTATDDGEPEYALLRDQLWFGLRLWLRSGAALHDDRRLGAELVAPTYSFDAKGRIKVESKDRIKERLERSPDRADALALAVYRPPRRAATYAGLPTNVRLPSRSF